MSNNYLDLNFDVLHAATGNIFVDNNDIKLVKLGSIVLFGIYNLTISSNKHLEDENHAYIVSLLCKLVSSARDTRDLSFRFGRNRDRRQGELTNNKTQKC